MSPLANRLPMVHEEYPQTSAMSEKRKPSHADDSCSSLYSQESTRCNPDTPAVNKDERVRYAEHHPRGLTEMVDEAEENATIDETLAWIPTVPVGAVLQEKRLEKLVVIPRIGRSGIIRGPSPFLRAYSPILEEHGVPMDEFIQFLDNLSIAEAPSPPLAVINLTAQAASLMPELITQIVTNSVSIVAMTASEAITRYRRRRFLEKVNEKYFAPRGLKVSLVFDKNLPPKIDFPEENDPLAPIDSTAGRISLRDRRMEALKPYISELSTNVPLPDIPKHVLDRLSAKVIKRRISSKEKSQVKMQKKLVELQSKGGDLSEYLGGSSCDNRNILRIEESLRKLDIKVQRMEQQVEEYLEKNPDITSGIHERLKHKLVKADRERKELEADAEKILTKNDQHARKKVKKLEYIIIENS